MRSARILLGCCGLATVGCVYETTTSRESETTRPSIRSIAYGDTLTDPRDAKKYPTVHIGASLWMARNLDFDTLDSSLTWCPGDTAANCAKYGRLYSWRIAMKADSTITVACDVSLDSTGICPDGWHIPSKSEWTSMADILGGTGSAGDVLKATSGWMPRYDGSPGNGSDSVGFCALPAGYHFTGDQGYGAYGHTPSDSAFLDEGTDAAIWSRTNTLLGSCWSAWGAFLSKDESSVDLYAIPRTNGLAVRCVKN